MVSRPVGRPGVDLDVLARFGVPVARGDRRRADGKPAPLAPKSNGLGFPAVAKGSVPKIEGEPLDVGGHHGGPGRGSKDYCRELMIDIHGHQNAVENDVEQYAQCIIAKVTEAILTGVTPNFEACEEYRDIAAQDFERLDDALFEWNVHCASGTGESYPGW